MRNRPLDQKHKLILSLSLLLVVGFATTTLVSFFVSRASLRAQIDSSTLPLTSDNVYSEIQKDLLRPVFISSMMAHDTFLRDWVLGGEKDQSEVAKYLKQIMTKYDTFTSFFVSEKTKIYYHADGILKTVKEEEERDAWYFNVREMEPDFEINVDPDMANQDAMTVFVNHKVYDYAGNYIGATGVGLTIDSIMDLMETYREKFDRYIYFIDREGNPVLDQGPNSKTARNIRDQEGLSSLADDILSSDRNNLEYVRRGELIHLNTRLIPELNWYLFVEQTEKNATENIRGALVVNLMLCALISAVVIALTAFTINIYQKITQEQQEKIAGQNQRLLEKNAELEAALTEVKILGGLLPICASCKKIRDDKGYWNQIEAYISKHSEAQFSHGLCPDCIKELYPEMGKD